MFTIHKTRSRRSCAAALIAVSMATALTACGARASNGTTDIGVQPKGISLATVHFAADPPCPHRPCMR